MPGSQDISADDFEVVVGARDTFEHIIEVVSAPADGVRLTDKETEAPDSGRRLLSGDIARIEPGQGIKKFLHAPGDSATIEVTRNADRETDPEEDRVDVDRMRKQEASRQNLGGLVVDSVSGIGTGGSTLPDNPIPDGFDVLIQSDPDNSNEALVGDTDGNFSFQLSPGNHIALGIRNTNQVQIQAVSGTVDVNMIAEDTA